MKLSTAIVALTFFTADARVNRRAQDAAADVAMVPDAALDAVAADNASSGGSSGSNSCPCEEETVSAVVDIVANEDGEVGGFAFEWNPNFETVTYKDSIGSNFSIDACEPFEKPDCEAGGDRCRPKTILYCPMIPGQKATFALTDVSRQPCMRKLGDGGGGPGKDIKFYIVTPEDECCRRRMEEGEQRELEWCRCRRDLEERKLEVSYDITATLKCGFRNPQCSDRGYTQVSRELSGGNNIPLGYEYDFDVKECTITQIGD